MQGFAWYTATGSGKKWRYAFTVRGCVDVRFFLHANCCSVSGLGLSKLANIDRIEYRRGSTSTWKKPGTYVMT
jgi:hypothetical protein